MITQKRIKELYAYNEHTGIFTRKQTVNYNAKKGDIAGTKTKAGYLLLSVDGKQYTAHRIAWLYMYGELPVNSIDHIDQNKSNNAISNLRDVTQKENARNCPIQVNNTSGVKGVCWCSTRKKWKARIKVDGKDISLGYYNDLELAALVRKEAENKYGFHRNHGLKRKAA